MTAPSDPESDCVEFVVTLLDWLEETDHDTETVDEAFELLSNERRRLLLEVMRSYGEAITLPDAAEAVTSRETGRELVDISGERVTAVYLSLYHDHLPRLTEAGLLEYDQERDLVSPAAVQ